MKKILIFIVFCVSICRMYAQTSDDIWMKDFHARMEALHNPIIIKTYNDSCYLEQHFYQDGNIYFEVPVVNGKRTGMYKEYYPNGQLRECYEMIDGHLRDSTISIIYERTGKYEYIQLDIKFRNKWYSSETHFSHGRGSKMYIYEKSKGKLVAEYIYEDEKWIKRPYHVKPVIYANRLFRIYRKEWKKRLPDVEF